MNEDEDCSIPKRIPSRVGNRKKWNPGKSSDANDGVPDLYIVIDRFFRELDWTEL